MSINSFFKLPPLSLNGALNNTPSSPNSNQQSLNPNQPPPVQMTVSQPSFSMPIPFCVDISSPFANSFSFFPPGAKNSKQPAFVKPISVLPHPTPQAPPPSSMRIYRHLIMIQETIKQCSETRMIRANEIEIFEKEIEKLKGLEEKNLAWRKFGLEMGLSVDTISIPQNDISVHIKYIVTDALFFFKHQLERCINGSLIFSNNAQLAQQEQKGNLLMEREALLKELGAFKKNIQFSSNIHLNAKRNLDVAIRLDEWLRIDQNKEKYIKFLKSGKFNLNYARHLLTVKEGHEHIPLIVAELNLEQFSMCSQRLNVIPLKILQKQIKMLDLSSNNLTVLPEKFGILMQQLERLYLNKNEISTLPQSLYDKIQKGELLFFDISNNKLNETEKNKVHRAFQIAIKSCPHKNFSLNL